MFTFQILNSSDSISINFVHEKEYFIRTNFFSALPDGSKHKMFHSSKSTNRFADKAIMNVIPTDVALHIIFIYSNCFDVSEKFRNSFHFPRSSKIAEFLSNFF